MHGRLITLGLIVAGFVVILPLIYWVSYLVLGFSTSYPWVPAMFYGYIVLPVSGLLFVLFGLRGEGEMKPSRAMGVMVSSLLLGILAFVIPSLLSGFFGYGPPLGILSLLIVGPFLTNLGALIAAFLGSWNYLKKIETGGP